MPFSPLQAIVDVDAASAAGWAPLDLAAALMEGGAQWLQVRAKHLRTGSLVTLSDAVVALGAAHAARVLVNDRPDIARLTGAAGVHIGQEDVSPSAARAILGPDAVIGYSTHAPAQVMAALAEPVTYIAVGPVFGTRTKATGYGPVGLALVREAVRMANGRPVVAIGGITLETAPSVIAAGATAVAVIGDLLVGNDPARRVADYLRAMRA